MSNKLRTIFCFGVFLVMTTCSLSCFADGKITKKEKKHSVIKNLPITTQGPFWPPSEFTDKNGDFIVVGQLLKEVAEGVIAPVANQAAIVSKDTVPPLDNNGVENFSNIFGAPYDIVRYLDLTPGGEDEKIALHTNSFGPAEGAFGGGHRIPKDGDSLYNLNGTLPGCSELFPTETQKYNYKRESFELQSAPINGFKGDNIAYDVETGDEYDPMLATGAECGTSCTGENNVNFRRENEITLGEWVKAEGAVEISLSKYSQKLKSHTAATFKFKFRRLLANSIYTIWAIRANAFRPDRSLFPPPTALGSPNVFVTDSNGRAEFKTEIANPFPSHEADSAGTRIVGLVVNYRSDSQNYGGCIARLGPGVEVHAIFNTLASGEQELTNFVTKSLNN